MRLFIIVTLFWVITSVGQTLGKGIYKGQKMPFTICYLTYTDSIIEVEYFFQKGGQIFGHIPAKKLEIGSYTTKPVFKSQDDSITVFFGSNHFLIKYKGLDNVKVYNSVDTQQAITILQNRNRLFLFSQKLLYDSKVKSNFDEQNFWIKLHSYNLEKYIALTNEKFKTKLDETYNDFKKNRL